VSIAQKYRVYSTIADKSRNGFYAVVLGGTVCLFGGIGYVLLQELLLPGGTYPIIDNTLSLHQTELESLLGPNLSVYGMSDGRRRRPAMQQSIANDGRRVVDAAFFVEGCNEKAKVTVQAVEGEDGVWEERYLALDLPGKPRLILVQPLTKIINSGWNPFSRWFSL
jgi:hypothetical protein